jgi:hypothetical protein
MTNWKRRTRRNLLFALLGGVTASVLYWGFLYTKGLHGFAVGALGPAIDLVWHHLDPNCYTRSYCYLEELAANLVLYAFWIFLVLTVIDLLRQLRRKLVR